MMPSYYAQVILIFSNDTSFELIIPPDTPDEHIISSATSPATGYMYRR